MHTDSDGYADAHAGGAYSDAGRHGYADSEQDADHDGDCHADSNGNAHANAHRHGDADRHRHFYSQPDANGYAALQRGGDHDSHRDAVGWACGRPGPNVHSDPHGDRGAFGYATSAGADGVPNANGTVVHLSAMSNGDAAALRLRGMPHTDGGDDGDSFGPCHAGPWARSRGGLPSMAPAGSLSCLHAQPDSGRDPGAQSPAGAVGKGCCAPATLP